MISNELGWNKVLMRWFTEKNTANATSTLANNLPPNSSAIFQPKNIVNAPNNAGKNFTQNISFPKNWITMAIQDVTGGTDIYPQAG